MSEDRLQQECVIWFNNNYPSLRGLLFSVPNGGRRDRREALMLKSTGLHAGVSDLIFLYKGNTYLLELKTETGTQSPSQLKWQATVEAQGFNYSVIRNLKTFQFIITQILERLM